MNRASSWPSSSACDSIERSSCSRGEFSPSMARISSMTSPRCGVLKKRVARVLRNSCGWLYLARTRACEGHVNDCITIPHLGGGRFTCATTMPPKLWPMNTMGLWFPYSNTSFQPNVERNT